MLLGKHAGKIFFEFTLTNIITNKVSTDKSKRAKCYVNNSEVIAAACAYCGHRLQH
jgi:hypothetical protein